MQLVIVVVDPSRKTPTQSTDKRRSDLFETRPGSIRGECDIEHNDPSIEYSGIGKLTWRRENQGRIHGSVRATPTCTYINIKRRLGLRLARESLRGHARSWHCPLPR